MSLHFIDPYTQEKLHQFDEERRERSLRLRMSLGPVPTPAGKARAGMATFLRRFADRLEPAHSSCQAPGAAISQ